MPKNPLGIMGLQEILGRDYGIEEPYGGPSIINPPSLAIQKHRAF